MWSVGFKARREVYLGLQFAEVQAGRQACQRMEADGWAAVLEQVAEQCPSRQRTTVWLSGALARPFLVEPIAGLSSRQEALQVARAQATDATGLSGPCEVWLDRWSPQTGCLAAAIESRVLAALQDWARASRTPLAAVRPWWNEPLNAWARQAPGGRRRIGSPGLGEETGLLSLQDESSLLLFGSASGGVLRGAMACWPLPEAEDRVALMRRQAFALGGSTPPATKQGVRRPGVLTAVGDEPNSPPPPRRSLADVHWLGSSA